MDRVLALPLVPLRVQILAQLLALLLVLLQVLFQVQILLAQVHVQGA